MENLKDLLNIMDIANRRLDGTPISIKLFGTSGPAKVCISDAIELQVDLNSMDGVINAIRWIVNYVVDEVGLDQ